MAEHPAKRSKKKVTVDSPFPPPSLREIPPSQEAAAVAELVALGPKRLVVGGNQVLRALENNAVSLVFLAGLHAPEPLLSPLHTACSVAQSRAAVAKNVGAEQLGAALGIRRALMVGLRLADMGDAPLLTSLAQVPTIAWLRKEAVYEPVATSATETSSTREYYQRRMDRKRRFREKQEELKRKHVVEKRKEKHLTAQLNAHENKQKKKKKPKTGDY